MAIAHIATPSALSQRRPSATSQAWRFDLPAAPASQGIADFLRHVRNVQILVSDDTLRDRRTNRLRGRYPVEIALDRLLANTGLRWLRTGRASFSIVPAPAPRRAAPVREPLRSGFLSEDIECEAFRDSWHVRRCAVGADDAAGRRCQAA